MKSGTVELERHQPDEDHDCVWYTIGHADPEILADQHVLDLIAYGHPDWSPPAVIEGDLMKVRGENRTVIYRIMERIEGNFGSVTRVLRWPD